MSKLIDPIDDPANTVLDAQGKVDQAKTDAKVKTERLKAWKREGTKAARQTAKADRIAKWEAQTGQTWEELWRP